MSKILSLTKSEMGPGPIFLYLEMGPGTIFLYLVFKELIIHARIILNPGNTIQNLHFAKMFEPLGD